jgi:hypothetical protein
MQNARIAAIARTSVTSWRVAAWEVALIVGAFFLYFLVRGLTEGSPERAFDNAHHVLEFQERLGFAWEVAWQGYITDNHTMVTLVNWVYMWGHWPFIAVVAIWLLLWHPGEYRLLRNAFLVSGGIGLLIFASFPVAPPRFLEMGLVDTVTAHSKSYRVLQPPALVNQYAAVPSLHFGWNLLVGITIIRVAKSPVLRVVGFASPIAMFFAIVLTANHFIVDAIAGGLVALAGLSVAFWLHDKDTFGAIKMVAARTRPALGIKMERERRAAVAPGRTER